MNTRIQELAERALKSSMIHDGVYRPEGYANGVSKDFVDSFAELIIQSCATIGDYAHLGGVVSPGTMIREYFGVEK